ncbi:MAG: penicillin-binding protein 2 [Patescibacteria group bacterium]
MHSYSPRNYRNSNRFNVLFYAAVFFFALAIAKLVWLQILHAGDYRALAEEQNSRGVVLPAKRGNIYAKDYRTNELFPLAQNSTTYTVFADPLLIDTGSEEPVANMLLPFLYSPPAEEESKPVAEEVPPAAASPAPIDSQNAVAPVVQIDPKTEFKNKLIDRLLTKNVVRRELTEITDDEAKIVNDSHLPGVSLEGKMVIINPTLIENPEDTATKLATILATNYDEIYPAMLRKKVRYAKLASRISADIKEKIEALGIRGVGTIPEYRRVYPEESLAAQVVGFLDHDEKGEYGIEGAFDQKLRGKNGLRKTQVDPFNRQITVGDVTIQNAEDGDSIVLTIDRAIQKIAEEELAKVVDQQRADGGQVIVMDPRTGAILALAHYPTFNPNAYGEVYQSEELVKKEIPKKWVDEAGNVHDDKDVWWETVDGEKTVSEWGVESIVRKGYRYPVFSEYRDGEIIGKIIYKNRVGEGAFGMKAATDPYEPGSVFKSIVMASALDAGEVTPNTRSPYNGPVTLDEINYLTKKPIVIKNSQNLYHGQETMTQVLENSSNIGMTFVAQKLGPATFYDYIKKFGFGERTEIEFEGEDNGQVENYTKWSKSELVTKGFGQGLTANLFQMAAAYSALANGGLLMKPYVIDEEILPDGKVIKTEPQTIRRVINPETSKTITEMLVSSVRNGYAKSGGVPGYFVAGKTGTSQTYFNGRALSDVGTTIATYGGYAPATDPKFIVIVKVDRPRIEEWGTTSAAPVFKKITEQLLENYFAIPPNQ